MVLRLQGIAIGGWLYAFLRRHNCEVHGCWRIGRHVTAGGHVVCKHHHPDGPLTAEQARDAHRAALMTAESEAGCVGTQPGR